MRRIIKNNLEYSYLINHKRYLINDLSKYGTKQRVAKLVVKDALNKGFNYLAYKSRIGLAPAALAYECAKYNGKIKLVLFCSAKKFGMYSDCYYPYKKWPEIVSIRFYKNYGKGNLEKRMKDWCNRNNGLALSGGFSNYEKLDQVFKPLAKKIIEFSSNNRLFLVSASGTLYYNLIKFFPQEKPVMVIQVDRNNLPINIIRSQDTYIKESLDYFKPTKILPPYKCLANYDAKAWKYCLEYGEENDCIFNVGKPLPDLRNNLTFNTFLDNSERNKCIIYKSNKCYLGNWFDE